MPGVADRKSPGGRQDRRHRRSTLDEVELIEVRNFTGLPDMATIRIADPEGEQVRQPPFDIGDKVEIKLGDDRRPRPIAGLQGRDRRVRARVHHASAIVSVRAYDDSHRLHRNRRTATFQDMTTSDIVQKVARRARPAARADRRRRPPSTRFMQQSNETDLDFLCRLAAMDDCEFGVADGKAFLRSATTAPGRRRRSTGATNAHLLQAAR